MEFLQQIQKSRYRVLILCVASPFLVCVGMLSLPLLLAVLPIMAALYAAWIAFGPPPTAKRGPVRSVAVEEAATSSDADGIPRRNVNFRDGLVSDKDGLSTIPQLMRATFEKFGSHPAMGSRPLIKNVEKEVTVMVDGAPVKKKHTIPWKGDYKFNTFTEMGRDITNFGAGLTGGTGTPVAFGQRISIFASTRPEWQVTAQAAFEHGAVVVTVYPSLGPDALAYSLNQTEASHLVCQASLMGIVMRSAGSLKDTLRCVIVMDELTPTELQTYQKNLGREVVLWSTVMERGRELAQSAGSAPRRSPQPEDLAVVMYTSGSTGTPKGVMMSHANVVAAIGGIGSIIPEPINERDLYIAFLPLAHVLELTAEIAVLSYGGALGFSSPLTLRDDGVCDAEGRPAGDLGKLRPTLMAAVPMILERLRVGVQEQVNKGSLLKRIMFHAAYFLKRRFYLHGQQTPLLDRLVFSKVAERFGGRVRYLLSGGAPLSGETHEFTNITVCAPVLQGYGLTESMCGGTVTHPDDRTTGNVGPPVGCCQILLRDEPEMGYTNADKPRPRGQICIGGPNITQGYFGQPELTAEAFFTDKNGVRYFLTGDIGQWEENGTLKIIDRKKDLVKLSHGEYIALGNLEAKYSHTPIIDNICVCASSLHAAPVAIVAPNHDKLKALGSELGFGGSSVAALCEEPAVVAAVLSQLGAVASQYKLEKWEKIAAVKLCASPWTPDSGLLTEAMKIKRHEVAKQFKADIENLYAHVH